MARRSQKSQRTLTQQTLDESFGELNYNIDEQAHDVVRYIIFRGGDRATISKSEIQKNIIPKAGKLYEEIMVKVQKILKDVYGYNLLIVDSAHKKTKSYIISNGLKYIKDSTEGQERTPEDNKILLLLILSHIFMSNNSVTDGSLYGFLKSLKLDVELRHPTFGSIKDYIAQITKEHYLVSEIDPISRRHTFTWGHRAEREISKHDLLKFVCKLYKNRNPKSWENQYKAACQQGFENHKVGNDPREERMEVEQ